MMIRKCAQSFGIGLGIASTICATPELLAAPPAPETWLTVVNNSVEVPNSATPEATGRKFNSYNPPSFNERGLIVFRARSSGNPGGPLSGVFTRDMVSLAAIGIMVDRSTTVPEPNNTFYPAPEGGVDTLAQFIEFPSFPRIAPQSDAVATRGMHMPAWTYVIGVDPETGEDIETRVGTTGVYVDLDASTEMVPTVLGAGLLGSVPEFSEFSVPNAPPGTRFDVFPGSPVITESGVTAFKGNYTEEEDGVLVGKTGIFYRQVQSAYGGGTNAVEWIASSNTVIPNPGPCAAGTTFGSTAPPSGKGDQIVFLGLDDEDNPSCGGIYAATLFDAPEQLTTLVDLNTAVPQAGGATFTHIGEGLSFDGRFVGFWGSWGNAHKTLRLYCPEEGNSDRRDFCNNSGPFAGNGDPNSVCDDVTDDTDRCYQERQVSTNQGIFAYDTLTDELIRLASAADFDDLTFWNYSGAPPGVGEGEGDAEPPVWRSSAFLALSSGGMPNVLRVAFQARTGSIDPQSHLYIDPLDGIYLTTNEPGTTIDALVETGMDGTFLDPDAVWDDDENPSTPAVPLPITSVTLEREAFRGDWFGISASMGVDEAGWAGLYAAQLPQPQSCLLANDTLLFRDRAAADVLLASADTARLQSQAVLTGDLNADLAQFLGYATIAGDVEVNSLTGANQATITGLLATGVAASRPLVETMVVTTSSASVTVSPGATRTLAPGVYGAAQLRDRSTLRLRAGSYSFRSFNAANDVTVRLDATAGPIYISVQQAVAFGDRAETIVLGDEAFPAFLYSNSTISFGHDGAYELFASAQGNITVRDRTDVIGCLQTNDSITLGIDTTLLDPMK